MIESGKSGVGNGASGATRGYAAGIICVVSEYASLKSEGREGEGSSGGGIGLG